MTNIEALQKLAKAIGIAAPIKPGLKIEFGGDVSGRDVLEIKNNDETIATLYKVSNLTPLANELVGGSFMTNIIDGESVPIEGVAGDPIYGGALYDQYNFAERLEWIVVHKTEFYCTELSGTQTAPSTGVYFKNLPLAELTGPECDAPMGDTIAEVLDYMAENYPSA